MSETINSSKRKNNNNKRPYIHNPWRAEVSGKMAKKRREQTRILKSKLLEAQSKTERDQLCIELNLAKNESAYSDGYRDAVLAVFNSFRANHKRIYSSLDDSEVEAIRLKTGLPSIRKINPYYYELAIAYDNEKERLLFLKNVQKRNHVATLDEARADPAQFANQLDELLEYVRGRIMGLKVALVDIYGNNGLANLPDGRETHIRKSRKK